MTRHYRVLRIASFVYADRCMAELRQARPDFDVLPYEEKRKAFFGNRMVYSDAFSRGMSALGHEAHEVLFDCDPLQKAWAQEHGVPVEGDSWRLDVVLLQIAEIRPDILYFQDIHSIPYSIRRTLKERFPFIKRVVVYKGYPGSFDELADVDILFTCTPDLVDRFRAAGVRTELVYHGFDEAVLEEPAIRALEPGRDHGFTFLGSSGFGLGEGHLSRYWLLAELMMKTPLEGWLYEAWGVKKNGEWFQAPIPRQWRRGAMMEVGATAMKFLLRNVSPEQRQTLRRRSRYVPGLQPRVDLLCREIVGESEANRVGEERRVMESVGSVSGLKRTPQVPLRALFPERCRDAVFGREMFRVMRASRVTLNRHTDAVAGMVGNIRLFEATGVGACLLTDSGANLSSLYEEGKDVVSYASPEECMEKANWLLAHEAERANIAAAGQRRTLREHTVAHRCREMDGFIQELLG